MTLDEMKAVFNKDEYLKFEKIPKEDRLSNRPDLHAFMVLDKLVPGETDMVSSSAHSEFFLDVDPRALAKVANEAQIVELMRCGVRYSREYDCLAMFA